VTLLLSCAALGCSSTHVDEEGSSGSHWLQCEADDECEEARAGATCGDEGFCVDASGERIRVMLRDAGGAGSGGSGGAGGSDAGSYEPCAGKLCGEPCTFCDPNDPLCEETTDDKTCRPNGACSTGPSDCSGMTPLDCDGIALGDACTYRDDQGAPQCCLGSRHLLCTPAFCTDSIPGNCSGAYEARDSGECTYEPCKGKACGVNCEICDPADPTCVRSDAIQTCDSSGECRIGGAMCPEPVPCALDGSTDTCGAGEACCAVGRCGPVEQDQGFCEPADPDTGDCMRCECEDEPGGCPICNSPDTLIATPDGERAIADLVEGDLVLSMHGGVLMPVPVLALRSVLVHDHAVVRVELDSGRSIEVSGSHPTAEGRRLDSVAAGELLGDARVVSVELVPYTHERTYDILPASDSGTYLAGGALLGSTLVR
jgi:hypothetical protein